MTHWRSWGAALMQSARRLSHTVATFSIARIRSKRKHTYIYTYKGAMGVVATVCDSDFQGHLTIVHSTALAELSRPNSDLLLLVVLILILEGDPPLSPPR